jgi:hypothetical protein
LIASIVSQTYPKSQKQTFARGRQRSYLTSRVRREGRVTRKLYKATTWKEGARSGKVPRSRIYQRSNEALKSGTGAS